MLWAESRLNFLPMTSTRPIATKTIFHIVHWITKEFGDYLSLSSFHKVDLNLKISKSKVGFRFYVHSLFPLLTQAISIIESGKFSGSLVLRTTFKVLKVVTLCVFFVAGSGYRDMNQNSRNSLEAGINNGREDYCIVVFHSV